MTEIKGARIHETEGMTVDGGFHIDDEEVRAGLTGCYIYIYIYIYIYMPLPGTTLSIGLGGNSV